MSVNTDIFRRDFIKATGGRDFSWRVLTAHYLFRQNERLRLFLVNHTMMEHPIHLQYHMEAGMFRVVRVA